jgi:hypothetical protein
MPDILKTAEESYLRTLLPAASAQLETASVMIQPTFAVLLEVQHHDRIFRLNTPIYLTRYAENGYIFLESKVLSIIAYGRSEQEAVESFREDFSALWDTIAQCPDGSLTPQAKQIKDKMIEQVNAVVSE